MKKTILLFLVIISSLVFVACENDTTTLITTEETNTTTLTTSNILDLGIEEVFNYTFKQLDDSVMPIGAWSDPPPANFAGIYDNPDLVTNEQYRLISESGINVMYGLYNNASLNLNTVIKSLQYAENNDVVYVVRDNQVVGLYEDEDYPYLQNALDDYKDYSAFGGVMVIDEPGTLSFDSLGSLHENFKQYLDKDAFYINLLPTYASNNQLINGAAGGSINDDDFTYEEYINQYILKVDPEFISYDFYPFVGLEYGAMRDGYFEQMSIVRNAANDNEIPYWVFIQACSFSRETLRVPNETEVLWQVSTALAYGAKGIQYFTYYTPMEGNDSFVGGMVDTEGNINPMYYYAQKANQHIQSIDEVLMNSVHKGVIVHGDSPAEIPLEDQIESFSIIDSIVGNDALIGCFNYQGKPAFYVVNNSLFTETANISVNLSMDVSYTAYQGNTIANLYGDSVVLSIPAGEGVLIVLNG